MDDELGELLGVDGFECIFAGKAREDDEDELSLRLGGHDERKKIGGLAEHVEDGAEVLFQGAGRTKFQIGVSDSDDELVVNIVYAVDAVAVEDAASATFFDKSSCAKCVVESLIESISDVCTEQLVESSSNLLARRVHVPHLLADVSDDVIIVQVD